MILPAALGLTSRRAGERIAKLASGMFRGELADQWRARRERHARVQAGIDRAYPAWLRAQSHRAHAARAALADRIAALPDRPLISVVMPVHDPPLAHLAAAIASVRGQLYPQWQLCIADDASARPEIATFLARAATEEARIRLIHRPARGHIAAATNTALDLATGSFVAFLDHDDCLAPDALARIALELGRHPDADLLFTDEDHLDAAGRRVEPYFKPGWNPDLLLGQNMVNHLAVYRRALVEAVGRLRPGFEGAQDYDLLLRVAERTSPARIRHIPAVLYHWRRDPHSFSAAAAERCGVAARRAVAEHLARCGAAATVEPHPLLPQWHRIRYPLPEPPRVSVLLPGGIGGEALRRLITAAGYPALEFILPDCGPPRGTETARLLSRREEETTAAWLNRAAEIAGGGILLLLDAALMPTRPDAVHELAALALRPGTGAVGARLLDAEGRLRQPELLDRSGRFVDVIAAGEDPGDHGQFRLLRTVAAVSPDCLAIRRDLFQAFGGFDATCATTAAAIDLCRRLAASGWRSVWTPFAEWRRTAAPHPTLPAGAGSAYIGECRAEPLAGFSPLNPNLQLHRGRPILVRPGGRFRATPPVATDAAPKRNV